MEVKGTASSDYRPIEVTIKAGEEEEEEKLEGIEFEKVIWNEETEGEYKNWLSRAGKARSWRELKKTRWCKENRISIGQIYNDLDQLICVICKTVVKSEKLWPVHLNSKSHKDTVLMIKQMEAANAQKTQKRAASTFQEPQPAKKVKGILKNSGNSSASAKANLPDDFFEKAPSSSSSMRKSISSGPQKLISSGPQKSANDAFSKPNLSNGIHKKTEMEVESADVKNAKDPNQSTLPEGFFDDPVKDAKARNVEYKDPVEEEWERFQKEIKEETTQSEQIIGEEQESAATERQIDEVEEQMRRWSRVVDIAKQKEQFQSSIKKKDIDDTSSDEEDYEEFLDWRAKKS